MQDNISPSLAGTNAPHSEMEEKVSHPSFSSDKLQLQNSHSKGISFDRLFPEKTLSLDALGHLSAKSRLSSSSGTSRAAARSIAGELFCDSVIDTVSNSLGAMDLHGNITPAMHSDSGNEPGLPCGVLVQSA